ncbi:MAG: Methyltransferase type 11 [Deltaproteobacteria bacterium]|nr:Methyltransferase type 11 [Deltaproteobacteria bacterium]
MRWEKAQVYERDFWSRQVSGQAGERSQFAWYEDRARQIWKQVSPLLNGRDPVSVLEIGPGPVGLINYIDADERYALDPLENYYSSQSDFVSVRDGRVKRQTGTGEDVLSLDRKFSLIILDNVLDHMKDPGGVLLGIHRSLEPGGIMFISLNVYTWFGAALRNLMEYLEIDQGHPFNFSRSPVLSLLQRSGFEVAWSQTGDYRVQKKKYRQSGQLKKVIKSCLGAVDFRFSAICRKV